LPNITYYVNLYSLGFGFHDNHLGAKVLFYQNNSFRSIEFNDFTQLNLTKNTNFSKPLQIQNYNNMTSAFLVIQDNNLHHLYIFNFSRFNRQEQMAYHGFIDGSSLKNSTVIDLQVYKNYWIISVRKKGVLFIDSTLTIKLKLNSFHKYKNDLSNNSLTANSILINNNALYMSIDNYGLKIII
jgi:hypothetical protein